VSDKAALSGMFATVYGEFPRSTSHNGHYDYLPMIIDRLAMAIAKPCALPQKELLRRAGFDEVITAKTRQK